MKVGPNENEVVDLENGEALNKPAPSLSAEGKIPSGTFTFEKLKEKSDGDGVSAKFVEDGVAKHSLGKGLLHVAKAFADNGGNGRFKRMKDRLEEESKEEADIKTAMLYVASVDLTFVCVDGHEPSVETILMAMTRRAAWLKAPLMMFLIALTQITLCVIALVGSNEDVNFGTVVMAALYVFAIASGNPFHVTNDLKDLFVKHFKTYQEKFGFFPCLLGVIFASPVLTVVVLFAAIFDFLVGRIIDNSYGSMINILVNIVVIACGVSVGLRSGSPISAVQTFAGFSFISEMDEAFASSIDFDVKDEMYIPTREEAKKKKTIVRCVLYVFAPAFFLLSLYFTAVNKCVVYCVNTGIAFKDVL